MAPSFHGGASGEMEIYSYLSTMERMGKHQYWLHDLEKDIGEKENLASKFPDKVKEMDRLIDEYIAEAKVVVPLPNPDFDPTKFDPSLIGVQAGGLKMPPVKKASGSKGPPQTVRKESMLGWSGKGMDISTDAHSMKISSTHAQPFLTNASLNIEGPALLKIRLRSAKPGKTNFQWRTADQKGFPSKGQSKQFSIKGGGLAGYRNQTSGKRSLAASANVRTR
jgi:hypothetical protein